MASTVAAWPTVALGEVLRKSDEWVDILPDAEYAQVTVRLWGKGAALRGRVQGNQIASTRQLRVHTNQFILSRIDARNGAFGLVTDELDSAVVSNDFPVFNLDESRIVPAYLNWMSKTHDFVEMCQHASEGTTNRVRLKEERFLALPIPLPPLDEQRRIVARIEALAGRIAEAHGLRQAALAEGEALMSAARLQALRGISERSSSVTLGDVTISHDSGWSPQCDDRPALPGEWGVLKTTCVQWSGYQEGQNKALLPGHTPRPEIEVHVGDVLITRAGPINRVGISCAVETTRPHLMLSDKIVRIRPNAAVLPPFLALCLATPEAQEYFRQGKTGLAESQVNISREKLLRMPVRIPSIADQYRIVKEVQSSRAKAEALQELQLVTTNELDALLPSVLDKAFRGEL